MSAPQTPPAELWYGFAPLRTARLDYVVQKATAGGKVPTVKVIPGSTVGISVDPVVADNGWFPAIQGQRLSQTPIKSTYFRFTFPQAQIPADGYTLEIIGRGSQATDTRGIWVFKLESGS